MLALEKYVADDFCAQLRGLGMQSIVNKAFDNRQVVAVFAKLFCKTYSPNH